MDPKELTHKWLDLSANGIFDSSDPFLRFVTAWIAFNSLYSETFSSVDGDKRQVQAFAADDGAQDAHVRLLQHAPWYEEAVTVLQAGGVRNVRTGKRRNIKNAVNLAQVMDCVYQVRCNLFHGGKHPSNVRDRSLAQAGYVVTANLVNTYCNGSILRPETAIFRDSQAGEDLA